MGNYTEKQINKVNERLYMLNTSINKIGSVASIREFQLYKDLEDNIFLSYICDDSLDRSSEKFYFKFDDSGNEFILNYEDISIQELEDMFKYLERIDFV